MGCRHCPPLEHLGFEALATTSMGYAFSMGRRDNTLSRDETLQNAAAIARATSLPVSADLENGFGDPPELVAETIRLAAESGIVGGSIEDATGNAADPIYDLELAVERVQAAVQAARTLPFPFILTARAENYLHGRPNLSDTIARLHRLLKNSSSASPFSCGRIFFALDRALRSLLCSLRERC